MRKIFLILVGSIVLFSFTVPHLKKLWSSDTSLSVPESVLYDPKENCLWVSCIDGQPLEKDGKGQIAQLKTDGRIIDRMWVSGLNAPKGMARHDRFLYVSDISELVIIDIPERKIVKKIPVEGATFLNDITVGEDGSVYISDMNTGKIHRYKDDQMTVYLEKLSHPNGILMAGNSLFILDSGKLLKYQAGVIHPVASGMDASTDGIEMIKPGNFIVSAWNGILYYVSDQGKVSELLDTRKIQSQTADIGFDPSTNTVFVPTFFKNNVVAYQLN